MATLTENVSGANASSAIRRFLLLEPNMVLRQTLASTVRTLNIGEVHQASSTEVAARMLSSERYEKVILAIEDDGEFDSTERNLGLICAIRKGDTFCWSNVPVIVLTSSCNSKMAHALQRLEVQRVLIKPFRIRQILEALTTVNRLPL